MLVFNVILLLREFPSEMKYTVLHRAFCHDVSSPQKKGLFTISIYKTGRRPYNVVIIAFVIAGFFLVITVMLNYATQIMKRTVEEINCSDRDLILDCRTGDVVK